MEFDLTKYLDENGGISAEKVEVLKKAINVHVEEKNSGLLKNRNDLLEEKKLKEARLNEVLEENKLLKEKTKTPESKTTEEIKKVMKAEFDEKISRVEKELESYRLKAETATIKESILKNFDKIGITDPVYREDLLEIFKSKAKVVDNDLLTIDEKPLDSYLEEWSATDRGKRYIADKENMGGGAEHINPAGVNINEMSTVDWVKAQGFKN